MAGILAELRFNGARSFRQLVFDGALLVLCAGLFFLNRCWLIGFADATWPGSPLSYVLACHGNDFLGGCAFLAYTNLLLDLVKPEMRIRRLATSLGFMVLCGAFWEVAAPLFVPGSVGDPLDMAAYLLGAAVYWALNRAQGNTGAGEGRLRN